jgi:hypothetical protein
MELLRRFLLSGLIYTLLHTTDNSDQLFDRDRFDPRTPISAMFKLFTFSQA